MKFSGSGMWRVLGVGAVLWAWPAGAQENLYGNKTPAQIFATDCAICHKTPQGLSKAGGAFGTGLEGFLREHYTASKETAAVLAKYVQSMDTGPAAPEKPTKRTASKPAAKKPGEAKSDDKADAKPESKSEPKTDAKPEAKVEAKPESKPEPKPEPKPEARPAEAAKPESKPEKSE